jgi:hypothetical protein
LSLLIEGARVSKRGDVLLQNSDTQVTRASSLPIVLALTAVALSVAMYLLAAPLETNVVFLVGYLLTPLVTFVAVAWDSISQKSKSRDIWFDRSPKKSVIVRSIAGLSLVPAVLHIIQLGTILGETAVQEGWFS